ncbi:MAG: glutamine-hydrolyzing carbamoyl-phosphate synthase small subunit [Thermoanaerobaculia bacterium]|nr:glutamine-hydrolyzing carbamoyl-phosphate synthase small subunit [Thermoanaerobaculia bacterium]
MRSARLVLEDGSTWEGKAFGADVDSIGEVVFNTSCTGYQEILTDPSYSFQIVVMTSPHIGNYGLDEGFEQSCQPQVSGFIVRELSPGRDPRSNESLAEYFTKHGLVGLTGVDTRALTRRLRVAGAAKGMIVSTDRPIPEVVREIEQAPPMTGRDLVREVTALRPYLVEPANGRKKHRIAVYDFGVKRDILDQLACRGAEVTVYPASIHPEEILNADFDGVVLSNGPGDPEPVSYAIENIRQLIGKVPILGICLGHQLLGLALGGSTYKLKFGHHGGNHPVKDLRTSKVAITAQNHGFAVDPDSLSESEIELTHLNLNDETLEGFRHRSHPILAFQFHPEAAPGPHDSLHVFDDFFSLIEEFHGARNG